MDRGSIPRISTSAMGLKLSRKAEPERVLASARKGGKFES